MPGKIDVHQHLLPPRYFEALAAAGNLTSGAGPAQAVAGGSAQWDPWAPFGGTAARQGPRTVGGWQLPDWDPRAAIAMMDEAGKETDKAQRTELIHKYLDFVAEQAILYPVVHNELMTAYDPKKLSGVRAQPYPGITLLQAKRT